ncbi:hypothetical protein SELMODRAFT_441338 [Selaginella moellendorffii]|uniref:RRM domain-containing protein n=1 Tax=Selaginella moellendorffii TaxID=88036 RepID=D8RIQ0_SELML|nr:hypothetical protein SELMODRAFT_441338 [Selaginella moellendorffii]
MDKTVNLPKRFAYVDYKSKSDVEKAQQFMDGCKAYKKGIPGTRGVSKTRRCATATKATSFVAGKATVTFTRIPKATEVSKQEPNTKAYGSSAIASSLQAQVTTSSQASTYTTTEVFPSSTSFKDPSTEAYALASKADDAIAFQIAFGF